MSTDRRPLQTRSNRCLQRFASALAKTSVTPNEISVLGIVFAALAAGTLSHKSGALAFFLFALFIQLRLLCNVVDGLVAVEGGKGSALGKLFNEVPDRVADVLFIVSAGYAAGMPVLGWFGAVAALMTAYVRAFGASLGLEQDFRGPMAKPHRMAALTLGCLGSSLEALFGQAPYGLQIALVVVAFGSVLTCWRRTTRIADQLRERG